MKKYLAYLLVAIVFAFDLGCRKEEENEKSSEKEILSFTVEGQINEAVINSE